LFHRGNNDIRSSGFRGAPAKPTFAFRRSNQDASQIPEIIMNILQINSSARVDGSQSTVLANDITARLVAANPGSTLTVRDLAATPHPALDEATLQALFTPAEARTPAQAARVAQDDALIAELQAADALVLGVPMYNFAISSQLKSWIDAIARARVTFRYTEKGPEGLLTGKKVYIALARGGVHRDLPHDTQVPYLKTALGFLGMSDLQFFYAEGLAISPENAQRAIEQARGEIEAAFA
jgi:FMN-dependent NADH-azoreductase